MARGNKFNDETWESFEEKPSKSEKKKEMERLQAIGMQLCILSENQLKKLPLTERTLVAVLDYQKITSNEAKRRQMQLIGKFMRDEELNELLTALIAKLPIKIQAQIQRWQERLFEQEEAAIVEFSKLYKNADRHTLRQLVMRIHSAFNTEEKDLQLQLLTEYLQQTIILSDK